MRKVKSTLALLAILASTSLTAAGYNSWNTADTNATTPSEQSNFYNQGSSTSGSMEQQRGYFRQNSYDYPSQGTTSQVTPNENINLRGATDENINLRGARQDENLNRGTYFRQDSYDYPSQRLNAEDGQTKEKQHEPRGAYLRQDGYNYPSQGYNQPQPSCPGGNCGAGANGQGQVRNPNFSNVENFQGNPQDHYRNQNYSGYYYNSQSQTDRRNSQFANKNFNPSDEMTSKIRARLQNDNTLSADARNIQITFDEGTAILKGNVNSDSEKTKIETIVQQVDGVKSVTNKLTVSK